MHGSGAPRCSLAQAAGTGAEPGTSNEAPAAFHAGLTPRELEVLRLISRGKTPREISEQLVTSPKTVASHMQRILAKLGVHSRLQAVARAYELELVAPDPDSQKTSTAPQSGGRGLSASPLSGSRRP